MRHCDLSRTRDFKKNDSVQLLTLPSRPVPKSRLNTAPKTHPWRLARAGPRSASVLRDPGLHEPLQVASLSRPRERAPERGGDSAGLRRGPAHASAPRQLRPSCPSARPGSHPQRPSGRGLTSPPTPSGSAFPRCAGRSGPAYTSSRRPGARSLCGGPWRGSGGRRRRGCRDRRSLGHTVWKGAAAARQNRLELPRPPAPPTNGLVTPGPSPVHSDSPSPLLQRTG